MRGNVIADHLGEDEMMCVQHFDLRPAQCITQAARRVAEYAFAGLHLESLVAIIHPENAASIRVARRLGMELEREVVRSDGVARQVYRLKR